MNAVYTYFFPTMEAPKPTAVPPPPKTIRVCFTRGNTMYTLTLKDVEDMTENEIKEWRRMVISHSCETYDPEESENANIILDAMDKRFRYLMKTDSPKSVKVHPVPLPTTE